MRLAFIITAHNDPQQLKRLIDSLPQHSGFYIHIDAKSDISLFTSVIDNANVHFSKQRINVMWGSYSQLESQIVLLREALDSNDSYDYFISLSGLDYPLWSNKHMLNFFTLNNGTEFIQGVRLADQGDNARLYRQHRPFNYKYFRYGSLGSKCRVAMRKIIYALGIRKPLQFFAGGKLYDVYKGSSWWALTRKLASTVIDYWDNNKEYTHFFHDFFGPDETFIHTIVFNSSFKDKALPSPKVFTRLEDLTPLTFIDYGSEIKVLDNSDMQRLTASGKMFCRKVVSGKSDSLVGMIDKARARRDN